jgi:acyl carrier protein
MSTPKLETAADRRAVFVRDTTAWINRRMAPAGVVIEPTTPLFEGGLIDSLRVLMLIAWTEKQIGRRIPDEQIRMDHFRDIATIAHTFVEE